MADELERLLGKRFIARTDVKAEQQADGNYHPVRDSEGNNLPWTGQDLRDHVAGRRTFGHYVVAPGDLTKIFCFDLDIRKVPKTADEDDRVTDYDGNLIADRTCGDGAVKVWRGPDCQARREMGLQLSSLAEVLARRAVSLLDIPVACAYSGSKGLHVYGLFDIAAGGPISAEDARSSALTIIGDVENLVQSRGKNFYRHKFTSYSAVEIEVFPKQDSLKGGDSYGNLIRLPLGVNRKSGEKGFFCRFGPPPHEFEVMPSFDAMNGVTPWLTLP